MRSCSMAACSFLRRETATEFCESIFKSGEQRFVNCSSATCEEKRDTLADFFGTHLRFPCSALPPVLSTRC